MPPMAAATTWLMSLTLSPTRAAASRSGPDLDVAPAGDPLGEGRGGALDLHHGALDVDWPMRSISARSGPAILTPTGVLMPVASMSMRVLMGMTQALVTPGRSTVASSSSISVVDGHPRAPLVLGLELDQGLDHGQRRRVGGGVGAADLAEHPLHLRQGRDQPIGLLQQLLRLADGQARQRGRHVHQVALVQVRHELGAEPRCQSCSTGTPRKAVAPGIGEPVLPALDGLDGPSRPAIPRACGWVRHPNRTAEAPDSGLERPLQRRQQAADPAMRDQQAQHQQQRQTMVVRGSRSTARSNGR
jgi:hypothetical protein